MIKVSVVKKFTLISLVILISNGCTFIVKDEQVVKYYGIDSQRGDKFLNQVLDQQQQVYQAKEVLLSDIKL